MRKVPLQPRTNQPSPGYPRLSPLTSGWERVNKLLQTFHQSHGFPHSHSLLENHSGDILPHTPSTSSPRTPPTKPKLGKAQRSRKQFVFFSPKNSGPLVLPEAAGGGGVQAFHPITPGSPSPARPDGGCLIFLQFCFNTHTISGAGSLSHFLQGVALPFKYFNCFKSPEPGSSWKCEIRGGACPGKKSVCETHPAPAAAKQQNKYCCGQ